MKVNLLPDKKAYKANLHTHSTLSDGNLKPEELAALYHARGYSILAITDHEFFFNHSDLNRDDFLLLTAYELQIVDGSIQPRKPDQRCCHLCIISKDPDHFRQVYFNPQSYDLLRLCKIPEIIPGIRYIGKCPSVKEYSREVISDVVKTCVENDMLVAFNHPSWSLENDYESYRYMDGIYAMEIYNSDCSCLGIDEYNPAVYDRMLREGMQVGCIATDDAHCEFPPGHPRCELFGGWTMVLADDLSYHSVVSALERGDFYASTGPEILELYYEDDRIHVRTSDAVKIALTTCGRRADCVMAPPGESVREAVFPVRKEDGYIRITVKDREGHSAFSRGYFLSEFCGA